MAIVVDEKADVLHELLHLNNIIIYGVKGEKTITMRGCCQLLVLCGRVVCLGYVLKPKSPNNFIRLPSPESHSFLTLMTEEDSVNEIDVGTWQLSVDELELLRDGVSSIPCTVVFAVKSCFCKISRYLQKFHRNLFRGHEFQLNDDEKHRSYQLSVGGDSSDKQIVLSEDWQIAAFEIFDDQVCPVIAICGGQNVGKSTFSKYLINYCLNCNRNGQVWYVECDPGQSEFVYPGCVSLKLISSPVFGPAYMNLSNTTKNIFVGGVSVAVNPDLYISAIEELFIALSERLKNGFKFPVFINTMGWSKGLGVNLLVDIIRIFLPSHVVQLHSHSSRDLINTVDTTFMKIAPGWRYSAQSSPECKFESFKILSAVSSQCMTSSLFPSAAKRSLVILAYLAKMQNSIAFKPINHFTPFRVGFSKVFVKVCHEDIDSTHMVSSLNGSLVALCCLPKDKIGECCIETSDNGILVMRSTVVCSCLGLGIVRCIDEKLKYFYLITPLSLSQLSSVNLFMMGSINIPSELLLSQICEGSVMYAIDRKKSLTDKLMPTSLLRRHPRSSTVKPRYNKTHGN